MQADEVNEQAAAINEDHPFVTDLATKGQPFLLFSELGPRPVP